MSLDLKVFSSALEKMTKLRPIPAVPFVDTYIKAYYLSEIEMLPWCRQHTVRFLVLGLFVTKCHSLLLTLGRFLLTGVLAAAVAVDCARRSRAAHEEAAAAGAVEGDGGPRQARAAEAAAGQRRRGRWRRRRSDRAGVRHRCAGRRPCRQQHRSSSFVLRLVRLIIIHHG